MGEAQRNAAQDAGAEAHGPVGRSQWVDVDRREHLRWVKVEGRAVNVLDIGESPVVVLLRRAGRVLAELAGDDSGDARKLVDADTGHLVMLERPARLPDLRAFLEKAPGPTAPPPNLRTLSR